MAGIMGTLPVTRQTILNDNISDIIDDKCQELEKYDGVVIKNQESIDGNGGGKKTQITSFLLPDDNDNNDKKGTTMITNIVII